MVTCKALDLVHRKQIRTTIVQISLCDKKRFYYGNHENSNGYIQIPHIVVKMITQCKQQVSFHKNATSLSWRPVSKMSIKLRGKAGCKTSHWCNGCHTASIGSNNRTVLKPCLSHERNWGTGNNENIYTMECYTRNTLTANVSNLKLCTLKVLFVH